MGGMSEARLANQYRDFTPNSARCLVKSDRLLALYWAVSTGMRDAMENKVPAEKKPRRRSAKTLRAA
jgi:hypothetical protein